MIYAKIIADSINSTGQRLTTLELNYPRFIHGELLTHRALSRNSMSSRAIPIAKMIEQVRNDPVIPIHWGMNQPGMQAKDEIDNKAIARVHWRVAANSAADHAESMAKLGLHKQVVNRILEPFQWMRTIVSATEWSNFFSLRIHPDAEPHIYALAIAMRDAMEASRPVLRVDDSLFERSWHLPYVTQYEREFLDEPGILCKISAARCARVSYLTHCGASPSVDADLALYERLAGSVPIHASPLEHQALACDDEISGNFVGWIQNRQRVEEGMKCSA